MKKSFRKTASLLLAAVVALATVAAGAAGTYAASSWYVDIADNMFVGAPGWVVVFNTSTGKVATITKVTSSNTKVVKVVKDKSEDGVSYSLKGKKKGKAKVTLKYKTPNGKTHTAKRTIKVRPYPNMIKSLTINGKAIKTTKRTNSYNYSAEGFSGTSVKVDLKPAKGWKIDNVYGYVYSGRSEELKLSKKYVDGSKAISFAKKQQELDLHVQLVEKKTKAKIDYRIFLER